MPTVTVNGIFVGRSGKPMAKARVFIGKVERNQDTLYAKIGLGTTPPAAVTDDAGRFQLAGVVPGKYTMVYIPGGAPAVKPPTEFDIQNLAVVIKSFMPALRNVEIGLNGPPFPDRKWSTTEFTLVKGSTLYAYQSDGAYMKMWNATVKRGPTGPYFEVRHALPWPQLQMDGKSPVKLEAWSY